MDVREKLVELIESARYCGSNTSEEIADNLLENGVTVQEWIPASEPPKKITNKVIAIMKIYGEVALDENKKVIRKL